MGDQRKKANRRAKSIEKTKSGGVTTQTHTTMAHKVEVQEYYSGPIPHPDLLIQYGQVTPDLPSHIVQEAADQARHRRMIENRASRTETVQRIGGLVIGGTVALTGMIGGIWLLDRGHDLQGFVLLLGALGTLITSFVAKIATRR